MPQIEVHLNPQQVAERAASLTAVSLSEELKKTDQATFVLAGGTLPPVAYAILADEYAATLDWHRVLFLIGDERCVPLNDPQSSWPSALPMLEQLSIPDRNRLRPPSDLPAEQAAAQYSEMLRGVLEAEDQVAGGISVLWMGMGEDGHTLSLFPNHPSLASTTEIVIPVHDSPKPPSDRLSFAMPLMRHVNQAIALVTGAGKADVVAQILGGDDSLPIVLVTRAVEASGGSVTWLFDEAAVSSVPSVPAQF